MSYWKSKVLPRIKKILNKGKKRNGLDACKSFDQSKEQTAKEIDEKMSELQPKVLSIYRSSTVEAKTLLTAPTETGVFEHSEVVQNLLVELANAGCPGAQYLSDAAAKHGTTAISAHIIFLFEKLNVLVGEETAPVTTEKDIVATEKASRDPLETPKEINEASAAVAKHEIIIETASPMAKEVMST